MKKPRAARHDVPTVLRSNERPLSAALTSNTEKSYAYEWAQFTSWCSERRLDAIPAEPETVVAYFKDVSTNARPRRVRGPDGPTVNPNVPPLPPRKVSGLKVALAAIRQQHVQEGYDSPHRDAAVLDALKTIQARQSAPLARQPLAPTHVTEMVRVLADEQETAERDENVAGALRAVRDRAIVLLDCTGVFRRGDLARLVLPRIEYVPDGIHVTLERGTAHNPRDVVEKITRRRDDTCPVAAFREWLVRASKADTTKLHDRDIVFHEIDRFGRLVTNEGAEGLYGMSTNAITLVVRKWLERAGLDPDVFDPHAQA